MEGNNWTLRVKDFRVLDRFDWSPTGVCLLAAPNGAGKTTTLDVLLFLSSLFDRGHETALYAMGGSHLKRTGSPDEDPVVIELETRDITWKLRFPVSSDGLKGRFGEELFHKGKPELRAGMFQDSWYLGNKEMRFDQMRCCAKVMWDRGKSPWMKPLVDLLAGIRIYKPYCLEQTRRGDGTDSIDSFLHGTGINLWSVLSNWKGAPIRYAGQFEWVMEAARKAFPSLLGTVEFDRGQPFLFGPDAYDPADGLPPSRAADGVLTGLLHLTAVAGAQPGSVVAIDEIENHLHPYAIRSLLASMRERAEEFDLTIILTTHSPVVMNEFKGYEGQLYVLGASTTSGVSPVPLDEILDPDWLAHFSLGDLYDREEFASPRSEE